MDNRRYQELRTYCMAELGENMNRPGYDTVMHFWVEQNGPIGRLMREEQLARSLFQCHDLTTRERAAAYLLAVITNHRGATWQREPIPPKGREQLPPLDKVKADEQDRRTNDAVTRYAAFLPDREAAVLLADCDAAPEQEAETPEDETETLDYSLLATRAQLLDAFEKWGLKPSWFAELNGHKWLLDARRIKGQGQRGNVIEPMFCPFAVMNGLIENVRKETRLKPDTAWRVLAHKFPKVHAEYESYAPSEQTGD